MIVKKITMTITMTMTMTMTMTKPLYHKKFRLQRVKGD